MSNSAHRAADESIVVIFNNEKVTHINIVLTSHESIIVLVKRQT